MDSQIGIYVVVHLLSHGLWPEIVQQLYYTAFATKWGPAADPYINGGTLWGLEMAENIWISRELFHPNGVITLYSKTHVTPFNW